MNRLVRWSGAGPVRSGASSLIWSGPVRVSIKRTGRTKTDVLISRSCTLENGGLFSAGKASDAEPRR
jgi:hypothetical protein